MNKLEQRQNIKQHAVASIIGIVRFCTGIVHTKQEDQNHDQS